MPLKLLITVAWILLLAVLLVLGSVASYLRLFNAAAHAGGRTQSF